MDWLAEQIEADDTNPALLAVYQAERASDADHAAGAISVGLDPSLPGYVPWSSAWPPRTPVGPVTLSRRLISAFALPTSRPRSAARAAQRLGGLPTIMIG